MTSRTNVQVAAAAVLLMALTLGGPLLWGFAFSGLGVLTWLIGSFGWLPQGWFASNLTTLGVAAAVLTAPTMLYALYRLAPRVLRVEEALTRQPTEGPRKNR